MNTLRTLQVAFAALSIALCAPSQARPEYEGVTAVVADAVFGSMNSRHEDPKHLATVMHEVNALRRGSWSAYKGKLKSCAVELTFYAGERRVGRLVIQGNEVLEVGSDRASGYKRELSALDAPATRRIASLIRRPSDCKK